MTAEKKVLEIGRIGCRESTICHEGDLKMMRLWIGSQSNFIRQSVLLKVGLRRTSLASLFWTRCKERIKEVDVP